MSRLCPALLLAALVGCGPAAGQSALTQPHGHCRAGEVVVFDCSTGAKRVSVCMSPDYSAQRGHLHYRFGAPGQIEIELPRDRWKGGATEARLETFGNGSAAGYLRFHHGSTAYVVYEGNTRTGSAWQRQAGVAVEQPKRRTQFIACREVPAASLLLDARLMHTRLGFMENSEAKPFELP
ncbi:MAG: hypothetical protein N3F11_06530 [Casimicrobiaceae bacterium]|nr:hypothetical protein [Casimicrobiaceae bacterium]